MVRRVVRRDDCKVIVENTLRELGYDVNADITNVLNAKECVVYYSGIPLDLESQMSYDVNVEITIHLNLDNQNELPYVVGEILANVTEAVEISEVPWCTGFRFTSVQPEMPGSLTTLDMIAVYEIELDWTTDIGIEPFA